MIWLEKHIYCIAYVSAKGAIQNFLDMVISRYTADMYQIFLKTKR